MLKTSLKRIGVGLGIPAVCNRGEKGKSFIPPPPARRNFSNGKISRPNIWLNSAGFASVWSANKNDPANPIPLQPEATVSTAISNGGIFIDFPSKRPLMLGLTAVHIFKLTALVGLAMFNGCTWADKGGTHYLVLGVGWGS